MMTGSGSRKLWRSALIATGVVILLWSGVEDRDATGAALLAAALSISATMMMSRTWSKDNSALLQATLAGSLAGGMSSVATAGLMLFKDFRHAHPFPDFPPAMILGAFERLPAWTVAGGLAGLGIGILLRLWRDGRRKRAQD